MTTLDLTIAFLVFLGVLGLIAVAALARVWHEARRLQAGLRLLNAEPAELLPFPGSSRIQQRAASIVRRARDERRFGSLRPESELASIATDFSVRLARPKAIAGLLIILGLLITLINLRVAVQQMQSSLQPPSTRTREAPGRRGLSPNDGPSTRGGRSPSDSVAPEAQVRQGIGGVASAAGSAFLYSMIAIGMAAVVLILSIIAHWQASSALGHLSVWLYDECEKNAQSTSQPQDTTAKLAHAADTLLRVATAFEDTNEVLGDLKVFSGQLGAAAEVISAAVSGLPGQIDSSMSKISSDVAHGIREGLDHQLEYLKALTTIYGDHGSVLEKTVVFLEAVGASSKLTSDALIALKTLPDEIRQLSNNAGHSASAVGLLTSTVQTLESRVAALPAGELARSATALADAAGSLLQLRQDVATLQVNVKSAVSSTIDEATRRNSEKLLLALGDVDGVLREFRIGAATDSARVANDLTGALTRLSAASDKLVASSSSDALRPLTSQIERLAHEIRSIPVLQAKRALGAVAGLFRRS